MAPILRAFRGFPIQPLRLFLGFLPERYRSGLRRRGAGFALALLVELLLILIVLTLGSAVTQGEKDGKGITEVRFKAVSESEQAAAKPEPQKAAADVQAPQPPRTQPDRPDDTPVVAAPLPQPQQPPTQIIQLSRKEMSAMDISNLPRQPGPPAPASRPMMGPAAPAGLSGDSRRVGSAPNGEPLYAASWYREPYDDELSGYLSTATPGWALIACRTAPDYRVEACVKLDEYPTGSNMARAVLAAAWQFKVRPPRVGGKEMVGEWVRIRITYGIRERPVYGSN